MPTNLGDLNVTIGADIAAFESGMARVQADLGKVAQAADAAAGRYTDAQGRIRAANGQFVSSATLAREAAANVGGSLGKLSDTVTATGQSINQGLVSSFRNFDQAAGPLNAGIGRLGESLKGIGAGLTTYVTLPLGLAGGAALSAFGKIESLSKGLNALATQDVAKTGATGIEAIGLAAQATQARLVELQEIAKAPGIGFEEAVKGDIRLRAVGISAQQSAKILREFANAIALTGGGSAELNSVTVQLGQLSAKGKVLAQDLRPIIEAAPAVSQALQKLYGTVDSETISKSLEKQGKSSADFVATLTDELAKIPRVAGGFSNALENALQGGQQNLARIGESINKAFNLEGLLERVGNAITGIVDYFTSLSPATQKFVLGAAAVAAAAGPIIFGLGAITAAIPSVVAGLEVLGLASTAALGPLGIGVAAVAAAAALIITNWDGLVSYFKGPDGQVFGDLADSIGNSVGAVIDALSALANGPIGEAIVGFGRLQLAFDGKILQAALAIVAGGLNFLAGNIRVVTDLFSGQFQSALVDGANTARSVLKPFQDLLGLGSQSTRTFSEFFAGILPAAKQAADGVDYFTNSGENAVKKIGTLKELLAELKAALEQRFADAQAGRDTTADDANIARIRALIAEYKQLPGHVDAATKAIQKLRTELAALTVLDDVLAVPASGIDSVQRRIDTLNAGLKRLLEAGVKPSSAAFRAFAAESLTLQRSLAGVQASAELASKPIDLQLPPATVGDLFKDQIGKFSEELLKRPLIAPIQLTPLKTDFGKDIADIGLNLSASLSKIGVESAAFGRNFDLLAARTDAFKQALQALIDEGVSPLSPAFQKAQADLRDAQQQEENTRLTSEALAGGLSAIGEALGNALGSGADVFQAVLKALLGALGDFAIQYGKTVILKGVADIALGNVGQGLLELAGGTALIAGGAAIKAVSSSGGGGGSVSAPSTSYSSGASGSNGNGNAKIEVIGELKGRGSELVAILRAADYRSLRTS